MLHTLWVQGRLSGHTLATTIGPLQIVFPGWPNHGRGPDFHSAIIAREDGRLLKGDVEVHVEARDWQGHSHHQDPAFNGVVLHVAWRGEGEVRTQAGDAVPTALLEPALGLPLEVVLLAGKQTAADARPCVRHAQDPGAVGALLDAEGDVRFFSKARALMGDAAAMGAEQALYSALLDALGYSKNRQPFRELAARVPFASLAGLAAGKPPDAALPLLQAVLLGSAGLLTAEDREVTRLWKAYGGSLALSTRWETFRVRPDNTPRTRVLQTASLVHQFRRNGLLNGILALLRDSSTQAPMHRVLRKAFSCPEDDAASPLSQPRLAAGGLGRAADMVVNVVLPFFYGWAEERRDEALGRRCLNEYQAHSKLAPNQTIEQMQGMLLPPAEVKRVVHGARRQQGLLELYNKRCAGLFCMGCALGETGQDRL